MSYNPNEFWSWQFSKNTFRNFGPQKLCVRNLGIFSNQKSERWLCQGLKMLNNDYAILSYKLWTQIINARGAADYRDAAGKAGEKAAKLESEETID